MIYQPYNLVLHYANIDELFKMLPGYENDGFLPLSDLVPVLGARLAGYLLYLQWVFYRLRENVA